MALYLYQVACAHIIHTNEFVSHAQTVVLQFPACFASCNL